MVEEEYNKYRVVYYFILYSYILLNTSDILTPQPLCDKGLKTLCIQVVRSYCSPAPKDCNYYSYILSYILSYYYWNTLILLLLYTLIGHLLKTTIFAEFLKVCYSIRVVKTTTKTTNHSGI